MKNKIIIPIDEEIMTLMEALHFDFSSYHYIMKTILTKNDIVQQDGYEYNKTTYKEFMKEYREIFSIYEMTKRQILDENVPEEYRHLTFNFNFKENCLESTSGCSCEVCHE